MLNRRMFLKSAGVLASLPLLGRAMTGSESPVAPAVPPRRVSGLLFDVEDIPRIRANLEAPRFAELRALVFPADMAANEHFLRDELRLENLTVDMARARQLLERAAFAYVLTKDQRQLSLAKLALRRICDYGRWDYFLEGGQYTVGLQRASEASIACCLALDWLGDEVTPEERARVEHDIATKGAPACYLSLYGMKYPDRVRGWTQDPRENFSVKTDLSRWPLILNATNLKVIPICGLGYAAIALHGRHPDADRWLDLARQSAKSYAGMMLGLDGAYDEGIGYWSYTTMHLVMFAEAMYRRLGIDERSLVNYPGTVRYALHMAMPTLPAPATATRPAELFVTNPEQDIVNFGDSGRGIDVSIAPWVAHTHHDPLAGYVAREIGGMKYMGAAIWYRDDAPTQPPGPELFDVRMSNDLVISRTGWAAKDSVLALRGGGPANHEHADRNSIIFKAYGERLFHDPFHADYSYKNPRWLLRLTEAHTAVLIGGKGHQYHDGHEGTNSSWAWAHVTHYATNERGMTVTSDATEAYQLVNHAVKRVERTLVYVKPDVLLVLDRVQLEGLPAAVQLRYQVNNDDRQGAAEAAVGRFTITRPHATLAAAVQAAGGLIVKVGRLALPAEEGVFPYAEVESASALVHEILTVATAQETGGAHGTMAIARSDGSWKVQGIHNGRKVEGRIATANDAVPVVTV